MFVKWFPFGYYAALLRTPTLPIKIREKTWDLDRLFVMMGKSKAMIRQLMRTSKPSIANIQKLKSSIAQLAAEIQRGIRDLKYISFYDSTMFYLYYRLLCHVFELCKREEDRLMGIEKGAESDANREKDLKDIKKAKKEIEKRKKAYEKLIKELKIGEKKLIKDYEGLVKKLRRLRWDAEKQAQHEFAWLKLTLRGMKNLNRKIKVEAIKVKAEVVPQEIFFLRRIEKKGQSINPQDVIKLANLVSEAIGRISKDVIYSFKLISKFENEMKKLKRKVEKLKKKVKNIKGTEDLIKPVDNAVKYAEEQINKDLKSIFRNIFVEFKYIATRQPRMAA